MQATIESHLFCHSVTSALKALLIFLVACTNFVSQGCSSVSRSLRLLCSKTSQRGLFTGSSWKRQWGEQIKKKIKCFPHKTYFATMKIVATLPVFFIVFYYIYIYFIVFVLYFSLLTISAEHLNSHENSTLPVFYCILLYLFYCILCCIFLC